MIKCIQLSAFWLTIRSRSVVFSELMYGIISGNIKILKKITKEILLVWVPSVSMWVLTRGGKPTVKATWRLPTILWSTTIRYQNTGSKTVETETETIKWQKMVAKICKKKEAKDQRWLLNCLNWYGRGSLPPLVLTLGNKYQCSPLLLSWPLEIAYSWNCYLQKIYEMA